MDYKPPKKIKKVYIPDSENPACNYIGLIIGPRGMTQKSLESKSGCKISIRGKNASRVIHPEFSIDIILGKNLQQSRE